MHTRALDTYEKNGYAVLDEFVPEQVALSLMERWDACTNWDLVDQVRPDHYKHVFATTNPYLPRPGEVYMARFDRARELEESDLVKSTFAEHFLPRLSEATGKKLTQFDARCYRLQPGHFFRSHIDAYAADVGIVYYINREWSLDWGGLLHIASNEDLDFLDTIVPRFNRLVLLHHGKFRFPHIVSAVSEFALKPRYTIVAFCR